MRTHGDPTRDRRRQKTRPALTFALAAMLALMTASCSDRALGDLGGRSGGWIGEVATTVVVTTTTAPTPHRQAATADWVNDSLGTPDPDTEGVLAAVFARSGDASRFLQSSRAEIVAVVPDVAFPSLLPVEVGWVTSQLVIESRVLRLADDPTVAFGMWSVEPYTRSRSVGQVAVLNVNTDPTGAEVANDPNTEPTCGAFTTIDQLCSVESFTDRAVWRLESDAGVTHVWYDEVYRYELQAGGVNEDLVHEVVTSMEPLAATIATR